MNGFDPRHRHQNAKQQDKAQPSGTTPKAARLSQILCIANVANLPLKHGILLPKCNDKCNKCNTICNVKKAEIINGFNAKDNRKNTAKDCATLGAPLT